MAILLKSGNVLYDLEDAAYNQKTQMYSGVPLQDYNISNLLATSKLTFDKLVNTVTIGSETFRPIDKFTSFSIVTDTGSDMKITGLKAHCAMLVNKENITVNDTIIRYINSFMVASQGSVKMVISFDNGTTWNTYNNEILPIELHIPLKEYHTLTEAELSQWNAAKEIISQTGFDASILKNINFKDISIHSIRFAFVLCQYSDETVTYLQSLSENYREMPHYSRVKKEDYAAKIGTAKIYLTSNIDTMQMHTNILSCWKALKDSSFIGSRLYTPILTVNYDKTNNMAVMDWDGVEFADYYKIYVNNTCVEENCKNNLYPYEISPLSKYEFCVKAFSLKEDILSSKFSNIEILKFSRYLGSSEKYLAVKKENQMFKFKVGG